VFGTEIAMCAIATAVGSAPPGAMLTAARKTASQAANATQAPSVVAARKIANQAASVSRHAVQMHSLRASSARAIAIPRVAHTLRLKAKASRAR
jgi:hypothetical protein